MTEDFRRAMGGRLREARTTARLTQKDVAAECFCSRQAVSAWERGQASPNLREFRGLAALYGVSADRLLYGLDDTARTSRMVLARIQQRRPDLSHS